MLRVIVCAVALCACVEPATILCDFGTCPGGFQCDELHRQCVLPEQLHACDTLAPDEPCPINGTPNAGYCKDGICIRGVCGDEVITGSEDCDGAVTGDQAKCTEHGFYNEGAVGCDTDCTFDFDGCSDRCGDGIVQSPRENCEPGVAAAVDNCMQLDYYDDKPVTCTSFCTYDISQCTGFCGDGVKNGPEDCDDADLGGATCQTEPLGYYEPQTLGCDSLCRFDTAACEGFCGDDVRDPQEICDGSAPPTGSCVGFGFDLGGLTCSGFCTPGFDGCGYHGWKLDPTGDDYYVYGVWGSGNERFTVGELGRIFHFNGTAWAQQTSPVTTSLRDIHGTDASHVWAVGDGGVILRYNGTSWSQETSPTTNALTAVVAIASNDVWAVGSGGRTVHYDGTAWSVIASGTTANFYDVDGYATNAVYVVGAGGSIRRWNGTAWIGVDSVGSLPMRGVWAKAAGEVRTVDANNMYRLVGNDLVLEHTVPVSMDNVFNGLDGSHAHDLYAVGFDDFGPVIYHFDGVLWSAVDASFTDQWLEDVWVAPDGTAYVGSYYPTLHSVPGRYMERQSVAPTSPRLTMLWGSSIDSVFAAGESVLYRYDGRTWTPETASQVALYRGLWGTSPRDLFLVGGSTTSVIEHRDATGTWSAQTSPVTRPLVSIWGSGPRDVWAAVRPPYPSLDCEYIHYSSAAPMTPPSWSVVPCASPTGERIGIWGTGPNDVWAVGYTGGNNGVGVIEHWNGSMWTAVTWATPPPQLYGIWGSGPSDIWVVGNNGAMFHYDGTTWSRADSRTTVVLGGIWGLGPDDIYATGDRTTADVSTLFHYDGRTWSPIRPLDVKDSIGDIWATPHTLLAIGTDTANTRFLLRFDRHVPWSCQPKEVYCADSTDDDCDGLVDHRDADCRATVALSEVHAGAGTTADYVEIRNRGTDHINLSGISVTLRGNCDATATSFAFSPDAIVAPGGVMRIVDDPADVRAKERYNDANPCLDPGAGGWAALCSGPCDLTTCANVLDYVVYTGTTAPIGAPTCVTFTGGPVAVGSATAAQSLTRVAFTGGVATDWAVAAATRD